NGEAGKALDLVVVGFDRAVVVVACVGDLVFGVGEVQLKLCETLAGLQLRVGFSNSKKRPQRTGERGVGLCRRTGSACPSQRATRLGKPLQRAALVLGVALDDLDQTGNERRSAFELYVDRAPPFAYALARADQRVVEDDDSDR